MAKFHMPSAVNLQMGASKEHPAGRVIHLSKGWNDTDDKEILTHPIISRLVPKGDAQDRQERLAKAEEEFHKTVAEAELKLAQVRAEVQKEDIEERQQMSAEYHERVEAQAAKGTVVGEPHPDRETAHAQALTAQPAHITSSASFEQKPLSFEEGEKLQEKLPSDKDRTERQQQQQDVRDQDADRSRSERPTMDESPAGGNVTAGQVEPTDANAQASDAQAPNNDAAADNKSAGKGRKG